MQDSNQSNNQNNTQQPNPASPAQANQPQQQSQSPVQPQAVPGNKEQEPISTASTEAQPHTEPTLEITQGQHPEVKIPQELKNVVEKGHDAKEPVMPNVANQAPATPPKQSGQIITTPSGATIRLPMTYAQAHQKKNTTGTADSLHWLATLIMYQWKKYDPDNAKKPK